MKRSKAGELGRETVRILEAGRYTNPAGEIVDIARLVDHAVKGTCSYPPDCHLPSLSPGLKETQFEVENVSTLDAARKLVDEGYRPAALNFASAKHPGGGFLGGARAQEESLARSSGLYACLGRNPMYDFHKAQSDAMYSNYAIYSPDVPVFRMDVGTLLPRPYFCSFITSPAVNAKVVLERHRSRRPEIRAAMKLRVIKVLTIAAVHGHAALVLGAWGCGVFGNDCGEIADLFKDALAGPFHRMFTKVVFAILDWSEDQHFIGPFQRTFGLL